MSSLERRKETEQPEVQVRLHGGGPRGDAVSPGANVIKLFTAVSYDFS